MNATIPKGNMGYDQYTCSWHYCSCRTYFCCFPLALANICPWPLVPFFEIYLKNSELKTTPQYLLGLSRALVPTTFLETAVCSDKWMYYTNWSNYKIVWLTELVTCIRWVPWKQSRVTSRGSQVQWIWQCDNKRTKMILLLKFACNTNLGLKKLVARLKNDNFLLQN